MQIQLRYTITQQSLPLWINEYIEVKLMTE